AYHGFPTRADRSHGLETRDTGGGTGVWPMGSFRRFGCEHRGLSVACGHRRTPEITEALRARGRKSAARAATSRTRLASHDMNPMGLVIQGAARQGTQTRSARGSARTSPPACNSSHRIMLLALT